MHRPPKIHRLPIDRLELLIRRRRHAYAVERCNLVGERTQNAPSPAADDDDRLRMLVPTGDPKSPTTALPLGSRMFSGLVSRCATSPLCAWARAPVTSVAMCSASSSLSCFSRFSRSGSDWVSTYVLTL